MHPTDAAEDLSLSLARTRRDGVTPNCLSGVLSPVSMVPAITVPQDPVQ